MVAFRPWQIAATGADAGRYSPSYGHGPYLPRSYSSEGADERSEAAAVCSRSDLVITSVHELSSCMNLSPRFSGHATSRFFLQKCLHFKARALQQSLP